MTTFTLGGALLLALANTTPQPESTVEAPEAAVQPLAPITAAEAAAPVAPAQDEEEEEVKDGKWHGSVNIGATYSDGNTDVRTVTATIDAQLEHEKDRHTVRGWWNYGQQKVAGESEITIRNAGGEYKYDYFIDERLYAFAIAGASADDLALLDLRWYAGAGLGYKIIDRENVKLDGEVGLTYFSEEFENSADDAEYLAARVAYHYWNQLSETLTFEQFAEIFPSLEDKDDVYARVDSRFDAKLTENMVGRLQHIYRWDNTPATGQDRVDNQVIASVGWGF